LPLLSRFYQDHAADRDKFEIVAFHDDSVKSLAELDKSLRPIIKSAWNGKPLPFPILLDATGQTLKTNYGVQAFPTVLLIDPEGRLVKDGGESMLEQALEREKETGSPVAASRQSAASLLAVAGGNQLKLYDAASTQIRLTLRGKAGQLDTAAFSPDGTLLAAGGRSKAIQLWDVATGRQKASMNGHEGTVFSLTFSPDGKSFASAGFDTVRLWDVESGKQKETLAATRFPCWSVAFSPDGKKLAAGGLSAVRLWDVASGKEQTNLALESGGCWTLAFSPDGKSLAAGDGNMVRIWNAKSGLKQTNVIGHGSAVLHLEFSPDGKSIVSVSRGKGMKFWDLASGTESAEADVSLREFAKQFVTQFPDNAGALDAESWAVAQRSGLTPTVYESALEQARAACRLAPNNTNYLATLGAALYRAGNDAEAIRILGRASPFHTERTASEPVFFQTSQLFLALAELRRGHKDEARAIAAGVRGQMLNGKAPYPDLLREMEAGIFGARADEARAALEKLLAEHQAGAEVLAQEPSLAEFRSTATNLLPFIESEHAVRALKSEVGLKSKIIEQINSLADLSSAARPLALLMSKEIEENPHDLNLMSWETVSKPGRKQAAYDLALLQAESAYRLKPDPEILNTVGVAQYRAGKFKQAIDTLERSRKANPSGPDTPADLAFLAMAQYRAGQVDESRRQLHKLREAVKAAAGDDEASAFLGEAEKVIGSLNR